MKKILSAVMLLVTVHTAYPQKKSVKSQFKFVESQTEFLLGEIKKKGHVPELVSPRTLEGGELKMVSSRDWTSGFFPGILWYLYEYTGERKWLDQAKAYTAKLEKEQYNKGTHDLGFMIYCSYGSGYRLTGDENYNNIIVNAARSLSSRFNPKTGVIKSWDHRADLWAYPVIIDNMMNLELLFKATEITGDSSFYKLAVSHANNTLKNHFRSDNSSYHVIDYDPENGHVLKKETHQGYSHESAWARGQAWALYGFTMSYRATRDPRYLEQAKQVASYILNHPKLPKDKIPFWDFDDPALPNISRDASAGAIIASALYELSEHTGRKAYRKKANKMLRSLTKFYRSPENGNSGFILDHSTGHRPHHSEIDVPLTYADYYYVEALLRRSGKFNFQAGMF